MSLPAHFRHHTRPQLTQESFAQRRSPARGLSLSSGEADPPISRPFCGHVYTTRAWLPVPHLPLAFFLKGKNLSRCMYTVAAHVKGLTAGVLPSVADTCTHDSHMVCSSLMCLSATPPSPADDLVDLPRGSSASSHGRQVRRRNTTIISPTQKQQYTYVPYSKGKPTAPSLNTSSLGNPRPFMSDMSLDRNVTTPTTPQGRPMPALGSLAEQEALQSSFARPLSEEQLSQPATWGGGGVGGAGRGRVGVGRRGLERRGRRGRRAEAVEEEGGRFDTRWSWHPAMFAGDSLSQPAMVSPQWGPGTASASNLLTATHSPLATATGETSVDRRYSQTQLPSQWQPAHVSTDNVPAAAQSLHPVAMDTAGRGRHHSSSALPPPTTRWTPTSPSSSSLSSSMQSPPPPVAMGDGHAPPPTTQMSWTAAHKEVGGAALQARRVQSDATPTPPTPTSGLMPMRATGSRPAQSETSLSNGPIPVSVPVHPASVANPQVAKPVRQVMPSPVLPLSFTKQSVSRSVPSPQTTPTQPLVSREPHHRQEGAVNNVNGPATRSAPPTAATGSAAPPTTASAGTHSNADTITIRVGEKPSKQAKKPRKLSRKEKAREKKEAKARAKASEAAQAHYNLLVPTNRPAQPTLVHVQSPHAPPNMSQQLAANGNPSHPHTSHPYSSHPHASQPVQPPYPTVADYPGHSHTALRAYYSQSRGPASTQTQLSPSHPGEEIA